MEKYLVFLNFYLWSLITVILSLMKTPGFRLKRLIGSNISPVLWSARGVPWNHWQLTDIMKTSDTVFINIVTAIWGVHKPYYYCIGVNVV